MNFIYFSYTHFEKIFEVLWNKFCELIEKSIVNIWQDVCECENKELWNKAYTLTLVPKWVQDYTWIKEGCEIIEGDLTEVWLYFLFIIF